jgi:hypothetical protein
VDKVADRADWLGTGEMIIDLSVSNPISSNVTESCRRLYASAMSRSRGAISIQFRITVRVCAGSRVPKGVPTVRVALPDYLL